jgi:hypothetical protein
MELAAPQLPPPPPIDEAELYGWIVCWPKTEAWYENKLQVQKLHLYHETDSSVRVLWDMTHVFFSMWETPRASTGAWVYWNSLYDRTRTMAADMGLMFRARRGDEGRYRTNTMLLSVCMILHGRSVDMARKRAVAKLFRHIWKPLFDAAAEHVRVTDINGWPVAIRNGHIATDRLLEVLPAGATTQWKKEAAWIGEDPSSGAISVPAVLMYLFRRRGVADARFIGAWFATCAGGLITLMENMLEEGYVGANQNSTLIVTSFPENGAPRYRYGPDGTDVYSRFDSGERMKRCVSAGATGCQTLVASNVQAKQNVLYVRKSVALLSECFRETRVIGLSMDEATFRHEMMACLVEVPIDESAHAGFIAHPIQMPEAQLDFQTTPPGERLARARDGGSRMPSSDPLVPTQCVMTAMHLSASHIVDGGLLAFVADCPTVNRHSCYSEHNGEFGVLFLSDDDARANAEPVWHALGDPCSNAVGCVADSGPTIIRAVINFKYHDGVNLVSFNDLNHGESNVSKNTANGAGLTDHMKKFNFLHRFFTGPKQRKAPGRWHHRQRTCWEAHAYLQFELIRTTTIS